MPAPPPTLEAALDRFYKYLEATSAGNAGEGRERWQRARQLVEDLRAMGDVGAQALMSVLAGVRTATSARAAARLLGQLQVPESLPLLKDIIEKDNDVLLRRAAASGLRQLQTPESIPVMERILGNPHEDRLVRLSAAYGLAEAGQAQGVAGLSQIFVESTPDGRGRDMAFRALGPWMTTARCPSCGKSWPRRRSRPTGSGPSATSRCRATSSHSPPCRC